LLMTYATLSLTNQSAPFEVSLIFSA